MAVLRVRMYQEPPARGNVPGHWSPRRDCWLVLLEIDLRSAHAQGHKPLAWRKYPI